MEFASKGYFLLLLLLIPYILWYFLYRRKNEPTMRMSDTKQYLYAPKSLRVRLIHLPMLLRSQIWPPSQQCQHHLWTCQKCVFSDFTLNTLIQEFHGWGPTSANNKLSV